MTHGMNARRSRASHGFDMPARRIVSFFDIAMRVSRIGVHVVATVNIAGLAVSAQGLGCMGMSQSYGASGWDEATATVQRAVDLGVTFLDTADVYGAGHNEGAGSHPLADRVVGGRY
jgi:aldo/keto reductase family protein